MEKIGKRLQSLDALRGFDMFWIMGAPMIVASLYDIFGGNALSWCNIQMEHASWDGFRLMDLVFPLFLFIAGVSFPFSLGSRREKKESDSKIRRHLLKRALTLVLLGVLYNGLLHNGFGNPRFASVLAHIGIAWFLATIIYMYTPKMTFVGIWIGCIVIGYGLLNLFVLSPDAVGTNPFLPENNIVAQFDRWFLPGKLYKGIFDPEGLLSLIPAVATALLGMVAGSYLKNQGKDNPSRKSLVLFTSGIVLILLGELTNLVIPFNKALWSSSFMLLTGGISLSLLGTFYWIVDVKKWDRWAFFFRVIGLNSITIYLAQAVIKFSDVSDFFLGSFIALVPKPVGELISGCGYVAVCWLFLWYLYKKNIFIKV
ncbi:MAG: DUF5009 domain-containing protein [Bacteroidales bacterium]|nr:DUF5009 domain-containing protein [Bacteroidales bacterium]